MTRGEDGITKGSEEKESSIEGFGGSAGDIGVFIDEIADFFA